MGVFLNNCCGGKNNFAKGRDEMTARLEDLINQVRLGEVVKKQEEAEKKKNVVVGILAVIGFVAAIAAIAFAVYKYFEPYYIEDFDDEDDDFDEFDDVEEKVADTVEVVTDAVE